MSYFIPPLIAFSIAVGLTFVVKHLAVHLDLVDHPDGHRKLHRQPIPLGGGLAILAAFCITTCLVVLLKFDIAREILKQPYYTLGLFGAGTIICLVGILDDRFDLRGRQKLLLQIVCVFLVVQSGLVIEKLQLFRYEVVLGVMAVPFTMLWLLGAINALNLIDGIDGLAGTVGVILSVTFGVLALMLNHPVDAVFAWIMAGSIMGFLVFNLPPAKIYLGDAGSMLIGLVLGVLAIRASLKGPATVALAAPTAIWAVLMFDVLMAVLRRKLTGQSVYATDRSHLHHVLQNRGLSTPYVILSIGGLCVVCAIGSLASVAYKSEFFALATSIGLLAMMVVTGLFGRSECNLVFKRAQNLMLSMFRMPNAPKKQRALCSRFHGDRDWQLIWNALVDYAERFDLSIVQLNVSSPVIGEEYHAIWERKDHPPLNRQWRTDIPLFKNDLCVGRLTVMGGVGQGAVVSWMSELIEGLRPFEVQLTRLLEVEHTTSSSNPEVPAPKGPIKQATLSTSHPSL